VLPISVPRPVTSNWIIMSVKTCDEIVERNVKIRHKLFPVQAMKAYKWSGGIPPLILNLGTKWEWLTSRPGHTTPPSTNPSNHWIGGWMGSRVGMEVLENKKLSCPYRDSIPGPSIPKPTRYADYGKLKWCNINTFPKAINQKRQLNSVIFRSL
jgi:hypothetical protein